MTNGITPPLFTSSSNLYLNHPKVNKKPFLAERLFVFIIFLSFLSLSNLAAGDNKHI